MKSISRTEEILRVTKGIDSDIWCSESTEIFYNAEFGSTELLRTISFDNDVDIIASCSEGDKPFSFGLVKKIAKLLKTENKMVIVPFDIGSPTRNVLLRHGYSLYMCDDGAEFGYCDNRNIKNNIQMGDELWVLN